MSHDGAETTELGMTGTLASNRRLTACLLAAQINAAPKSRLLEAEVDSTDLDLIGAMQDLPYRIRRTLIKISDD